MSGVVLAPKTRISVNMNLSGEEMNENSSLPLWEDTVTCLNDEKMQHSPSGRSLFEENDEVVEGSWLEDPDSGPLSGEISVRTQALIEGLEIDMSNKNGVNGGVITPTKAKGGDHYHRHKSRLNRKSIDETLPDRQPKKSMDETLPDVLLVVTGGAPSPKAVSPAQSPHTVSGGGGGGRKGSFRRRRKNSNKHLNFIGGVDDLSDDSDSGGGPSSGSSSFVKVSLEVLSPTASPASSSAASAVSTPQSIASPEVTASGGVSAKDSAPKTPGTSMGSPYLFHHQTRMQQSPYFRALFGNMSIAPLDESTSTSEVPTPPTVDENTGENTPVAGGTTSRRTPTEISSGAAPDERDPLRIELFSDDEGGDFGPGSASSATGTAIPVPEAMKRSSSYETSWPSLPKPSRSKSSSLMASVLGGSPMSPPRTGGSGGSALTPNNKLSPGSRLSGRKSSSKKSLSSDSLRWLRSDRYLSSLLLNSGNKTPKDRRSVSSAALLTDSPRRMRFPEPDSVLKSPIPFPLSAMELSDTVAVTTPTRYSQMLSPDRHTKLFPMSSSTPPEPLSPLPPTSPTPSFAVGLQLQLPKVNVNAGAVPSSSSSSGSGVVDPFELSLKPMSPTVTHHHMSYARYLAMTATPKSLSRTNTSEELAAAVAAAEAEESNDLVESCFTELDPQAVVRCLYNTYIAEDKTRTHSLGGFPIRSMTNNLNLASLNNLGGLGGIAAVALQPRKKSWDDPDTESDDEEETECDSGVRSSLLSSTPAEEFQEHVRSFGMSCNVPMFESTLKRCSYFKTLPQERIQAVDFMWMLQQIYPTHYVLRKGRELSLDNLTGEKVLSSYLSRSYVFNLVGALSHEDDRVTSSRLSVLKMFYLRIPNVKKGEEEARLPSLDDEKKHINSPAASVAVEERCSMRKSIVVAMEHATFSRLERCVDSAKLSAECEIDNNYIAKRGYTADGMFVNTSTNSNAQHRDAALRLGCAIGATTKDSEERPAYKTRDNDNNMLELMKFVIACEIGSIESSLEGGCDAKSTSFCVQTSIDLLLNLVRVFFNIFRCYGYKLGNSSEHLELPDLLNSLMECLEGLLLWSHLVSIHLHWQRKAAASIDDATYSEPFYNSLCLLMLSRVSKYWTRHCNFAQEIAFIRVTETLLSVYTPLMSMPEAVTPAQSMLLPTTLSLQIPSSSSEGIPGKCLRKLLCSLTSAHFKVSLQAIQSMQGGSVLSKYILPAIRPDQFVSVMEEQVTHEDLAEVTTKRNSNSNSSNGGGVVGTATTMKNVGLTVDDREAGLIVLVDRLRQNRTHWHPVVQQSSTLLMNMVYDRLQEIEDAQECEMEDTGSDSYDPEDGNFL